MGCSGSKQIVEETKEPKEDGEIKITTGVSPSQKMKHLQLRNLLMENSENYQFIPSLANLYFVFSTKATSFSSFWWLAMQVVERLLLLEDLQYV